MCTITTALACQLLLWLTIACCPGQVVSPTIGAHAELVTHLSAETVTIHMRCRGKNWASREPNSQLLILCLGASNLGLILCH